MVTNDQYWYFCHPNPPSTPLVNRTDDVVPGETTRVVGTPRVGKWGLHGSKRLLDALMYTPYGASLALVTLGGELDHGPKQTAATERTVIAVLPPDETARMLREFAAETALSLDHLWDMPDVTKAFLETLDPQWRVQAVKEAEAVMTVSGSSAPAKWAAVFTALWAVLSWDPAGQGTFSVVDVRYCVTKAAEAKAWAAVPNRDTGPGKVRHWESVYHVAMEEMDADLERRAIRALAQTQPAEEVT